jgi:hypothetical protein
MDPAGPIKRQECEIRRWRDLDSSGYGRPSSFAEIIAGDIGLGVVFVVRYLLFMTGEDQETSWMEN